ncbi:MAG: ribonuclease E/G, partial [Lactobacillales bacterium]|nr:ribonuclease E/G [Lactobacillales bacterium]
MSKKMLIDATHAEETRVVILSGGRLEELDVDTSTKKQIKGNIYLAKIVRVEPSLQAAFVEYGGNRHGFLAFGEIHPDYYQIPTADREALKKEMMKQSGGSEDDGDKDDRHQKDEDVEVVSESETEDVVYKRPSFLKRYRIQEVIHQGQIMLVQVVKEERGNKGAALTTYLSLAGRFSVLMPNNGKGGGVSRKITNAKDRKSLRDIVDKLPIPDGMSVIVRTAGQGKTKSDIKRDYDYLIKTWMKIRENTLESIAPKLIHQEGDIIKRSLRDVFTPDIDEILVEGEETFKDAKAFMKLILPTYVKRVKQYKDKTPLFLEYQVESQLEAIHSNVVQLRSGGYIVIDQTEALVSVDVNSGRATREHNIEETALRTNLETCEELARQLKLRDLAGLIVIDFIDMDEGKNNAAVERALKEALKKDRARIQVGRISGFGLLEMSRQRLHSSFLEGSYNACPCCSGKGLVRSIESCAMHALHLLEEAALKNPEGTLVLSVPLGVASYVLNNKRLSLVDLETKYGVAIQIAADATLPKQSDYKLERLRVNGERVLIQHAANEASIRKENDRGRNNGGHNKKNKQQSSKQGASENKETEKRETQKRPPEKKEEKTVHKKDVADKTESVANGGGEADPAQSEA